MSFSYSKFSFTESCLCFAFRRAGCAFSSGLALPIKRLGGAVGFLIESKIKRSVVLFPFLTLFLFIRIIISG